MNPEKILKNRCDIPPDEYAHYLEQIQIEDWEHPLYLCHAQQEAIIRADKSCTILCEGIDIPFQVQALIVESIRLRAEREGLPDKHTSASYDLAEKLHFVRSLISDWLLEEMMRVPERISAPKKWHASYAVGRHWKMLVFATNDIVKKELWRP